MTTADLSRLSRSYENIVVWWLIRRYHNIYYHVWLLMMALIVSLIVLSLFNGSACAIKTITITTVVNITIGVAVYISRLWLHMITQRATHTRLIIHVAYVVVHCLLWMHIQMWIALIHWLGLLLIRIKTFDWENE